jgi:hypothetical protein
VNTYIGFEKESSKVNLQQRKLKAGWLSRRCLKAAPFSLSLSFKQTAYLLSLAGLESWSQAYLSNSLPFT